MESLAERQQLILKALIDVHVECAEPVGSRTLARKVRLLLSPATIRNEMSDLEEMGYVTHPHTSAGRIPTDKGYRYYVDYLLGSEEGNLELARTVMEAFERKIRDLNELIALTIKVVSMISEQVTVITYPECDSLIIKKVDLVPVDRFHVLVIWTSTSGIVFHQEVGVDEALTESLLNSLSQLMQAELRGLRFSEASSFLLTRLNERRDSLTRKYELARRIVMDSLSPQQKPALKLGGSDYIMEKPEFQDIHTLRRLFHVLASEDVRELWTVVRSGDAQQAIQARIGRENPEGMEDCSVIIAPYRLTDGACGTLALVGPRRMPYRKMFGLLRCVTQVFPQAYDRLNEGREPLCDDDQA